LDNGFPSFELLVLVSTGLELEKVEKGPCIERSQSVHGALAELTVYFQYIQLYSGNPFSCWRDEDPALQTEQVSIMLLTNTENIPGKNYEIIGLVSGNMIQSKNIGKDIGQGLKTIVGGELKTYTKMMGESRGIATQRMVENAEEMGADAVVCIRYATSAIMGGAAEMVCYGTAVKFV